MDQHLIDSIQGEIAAERQGQWEKELASGHNPNLDPERTAPAEDFALWQNMLRRDQQIAPPENMLPYLERNELGDAELFQALHEHEYVFDHSREKWLRFGGVIWEDDVLRCSTRAVMDMADLYAAAGRRAYAYYAEQRADLQKDIATATEEQTRLEITAPLDDDTEELRRNKKRIKDKLSELQTDSDRLLRKAQSTKKAYDERAKALRSMKRTEQVLKTAASGAQSLGRTGKEFDTHPTLLAFANGVVDLETGLLLRGDPGLYLSRISPYEYHGLNVPGQWWEDHLRMIFCGNEELQEFFEYSIGHSATGLQVNKHLLCAIGPHADNGKSFTFNTIKQAMGNVATTLKVDVLLEEKFRNRGPDPDIMVLDGIRMGICSEAPQNCKFSMDRIKTITGGDDVRARGMYADSKIINSRVKLWLHTNDVPSINGYDPGFMLRLMLIPFNAQFVSPEMADPEQHKYPALGKMEIEAKQKEAWPSVVSWIVRCAHKFLKNTNYPVPEIVRRNTKIYFEDEDIIGRFFEQCCFKDADGVHTSEKLWKVFAYWCVTENGMSRKYVKSTIMFSKELSKRNDIRKIQSRPVTKWCGMRLKEEWIDKELEQK